MPNEIAILAGTAASIAFVHTMLGPDHYLPFIVLARSRQWSGPKTAFVTFLCGIGHILGSIALGFVGIALGVAVFRLEAIQSYRGEVAGGLLLGFGLVYFIWGVRRAIRSRPHQHAHAHEDGGAHLHPHGHTAEHTHVHIAKGRSLTVWVLFVIFLFGPSEPLIPILMYPAATSNMASVAVVAAVYGVMTLTTMLGMVMASYYGLTRLSLPGLERYMHALAGFAILISGTAVMFMGL